MWHGVAWLVTGCLLALWSLGAWVLHAVAQWGAGFAVGASANVLSFSWFQNADGFATVLT
jgi:hypothetical protein